MEVLEDLEGKDGKDGKGKHNGYSNVTNLTIVTVQTDIGFINAAELRVKDLENSDLGVIIHAEGANAFVEVTADTVAEVLALAGFNPEDPLLFSVVAVNEDSRSNFEVDAILGNASVLSSAALSINFWSSNGSRIEVKELTNALQFTLTDVTDPNATCAFWNEDTAKWSTDGTETLSANGGIRCSTSHLTIFGAIKDVFLSNVVLALKCSTVSILSGPGFAKLQDTAWLSSTPFILNIVFHVLGVACVLLAWMYDRKQERVIPWEEREIILLRVTDVKDDTEEEEDHDDGDAPPPSRCTRCMGCFNHTMEYVSHASGGDATVEALKEMAGNADTAAVNRAISTIQSHKAGISRAQIAIFNQQQTKKVVDLKKAQLRRSVTTASEVLGRSADHGKTAAETFLQRGFLCRVATLWPASHPWVKATHFSMIAPVRVSVALLFLKVTSAATLSAVFFSSSSPSPDSDPECLPPTDPVAKAVQSLTVGLITALLSDVVVSILFSMQLKKVVWSTEWTEEKKRRQHFRWNMWTASFWLIFLLYGGFCELYMCLFLANVGEADQNSWLQSVGASLLDDLLVKSFFLAFAMASIATLVLCCRPRVMEKVQAKWIEDNQQVDQDEANLEANKADKMDPEGHLEENERNDIIDTTDEDSKSEVFEVKLDMELRELGIDRGETPETPEMDIVALDDDLGDGDSCHTMYEEAIWCCSGL